MPCLVLLVGMLLILAGTGWADPTNESQTYRIGPNDVIRIQVFGEDDLTVESKVAGDGAINYPLLGSVLIAGKTIKELQEFLSTRLAEGYVRSPRVTVFMMRYRNFYVSGEVKAPGGYPYESGLTVQKAVSIAGGFTEKADSQSVKVTRVKDASITTLSAESDMAINADDIIMVEAQHHRFYISGEVKSPGSYAYRDGLSVQKVIAQAGGLTEKADKTGVKVTRSNGMAVEMTLLEADMPVMADDLIVVAQARKFYINGEVKQPGVFSYEKGLTVHKAVTMAGGFTDKASKNSTKVLRTINGEEQKLETSLEAPVLPDDIIMVPQRFF